MLQRPQHGDVHQDVDEVLVVHGGAVHRDHERPLAELRDVLQDAPEVGRSHGGNVILASLPQAKDEAWARPPDLRDLRHRPRGARPPAREGLEVEVYPEIAAAAAAARPREGALRHRRARHHAARPHRRGGVRGGRGVRPQGRGPDGGRLRQHRPRRRQPPPDPVHAHGRRADGRHRRVRVLHAGRGRAQALPGRAAGARAPVGDLAPVQAVARRRGHRPHAGRGRAWAASARASCTRPSASTWTCCATTRVSAARRLRRRRRGA